MSHFYGGVQGGRGPATRTGSQRSGIRAYGKSWVSQVEVEYWSDDGYDLVRVSVRLLGSESKAVLWEGREGDLVQDIIKGVL